MVKKSILTLGVVALFAATGSVAAEAPAKYNQSCIACHVSGAAGAPKTHDVAAWKPRMEKGMDTLVKHAREGFNAMPPTAMCADCTDEEYKALIEFMASPAK